VYCIYFHSFVNLSEDPIRLFVHLLDKTLEYKERGQIQVSVDRSENITSYRAYGGYIRGLAPHHPRQKLGGTVKLTHRGRQGLLKSE
jgi:hypothetical protein